MVINEQNFEDFIINPSFKTIDLGDNMSEIDKYLTKSGYQEIYFFP